MDSLSPKHVFLAPDIVRTRGVEAGAGVYMLAGRCHFAKHGSDAERELMEAGALHVANLRFERDPLEGSHPGRRVRSMPALEAAIRFAEASRS